MRSSHLTDGVVLLRPPTADDVDAITQACQDPEIAAWAVSYTHLTLPTILRV